MIIKPILGSNKKLKNVLSNNIVGTVKIAVSPAPLRVSLEQDL